MDLGPEATADEPGTTSDAGSARDAGAAEPEADARVDGRGPAQGQDAAEPRVERAEGRQAFQLGNRSRGPRAAADGAQARARARSAEVRAPSRRHGGQRLALRSTLI